MTRCPSRAGWCRWDRAPTAEVRRPRLFSPPSVSFATSPIFSLLYNLFFLLSHLPSFLFPSPLSYSLFAQLGNTSTRFSRPPSPAPSPPPPLLLSSSPRLLPLLLRRGARLRPHRTRRHLRARLPAHGRGAAVRTAAGASFCICMCACMCVCMCACVCVRVCVRICIHEADGFICSWVVCRGRGDLPPLSSSSALSPLSTP